jgi:hypothetical protein
VTSSAVFQRAPFVERDTATETLLPCCSRFDTAFCHAVSRMSSPLTVATAVVVVTGARPERPDVSYSKKLPMKATTRNHQMYFATLRIDCSTTGRDSLGRKNLGKAAELAPRQSAMGPRWGTVAHRPREVPESGQSLKT